VILLRRIYRPPILCVILNTSVISPRNRLYFKVDLNALACLYMSTLDMYIIMYICSRLIRVTGKRDFNVSENEQCDNSVHIDMSLPAKHASATEQRTDNN